jgi:hypothetical protein
MATTAREVRKEEQEEIVELKELVTALRLLVSIDQEMNVVMGGYRLPSQKKNVLASIVQSLKRIGAVEKELNGALRWDSRVVVLAVTVENQLRAAAPRGQLSSTEMQAIGYMKNFKALLQGLVNKEIPYIEKAVTFIETGLTKGTLNSLSTIDSVRNVLHAAESQIRIMAKSINAAIQMERRASVV